ncbi:hypothetical protein ACLESO_20535 [Pyxidicoccus sp. 3LG]
MPAIIGAIAVVMFARGQEPAVPPETETQTESSESPSEIGETTSEVLADVGSEADDAGTEVDDAGTEADDAGMEAYPEVRSGHMLFKVLGVKQEAVGSGPRATLTLSISIRVTDVVGKPDYVDSQTIRLAVDGAELLPENSINTSLFARQSIVAEPVFTVPADARQVELLVGREADGTERIPLRLSGPSDATQE